MSYYRLLFMKSPEGPVIGSEEIKARDDLEAVHIARERVGPQPIELWCDKRKIKRFHAVEAQPTFAF
jgi:hypothetical protein